MSRHGIQFHKLPNLKRFIKLALKQKCLSKQIVIFCLLMDVGRGKTLG